jgi:hypothetical protein
MTDVPSEVLSEHFQERMQGRRVVSAVFTTFQLDPAFFETEVLPVFFDIPLSHVPAIKLVQLEDAIRELGGSIAVYYDQRGLAPDGGSAKLDIKRVPIHHERGIFHPKNVFVLFEAAEEDESGHRKRALLVACASANLTRTGWWENVEVAHVEEIAENETTNLRDPLIEYLDALIRAAEGRRPNDELRKEHAAVNEIREFLRSSVQQRQHRSYAGRLHPHFHDGQGSLPEFIEEVTGRDLHGFCVEVISPYFDASGAAPLEALIARFEPKEMRVYLPQDDRGQATCPEALYAWVNEQPGLAWGSLPSELRKLGQAAEARYRGVHAKVYRFFERKRGGREILYVGSANSTMSGCLRGRDRGNWESGFLVEVTSGARPDFWLAALTKAPAEFRHEAEDHGAATRGGTRLVLRFRWDQGSANAFWGGASESPALSVRHGGASVFELDPLPPKEWTELSAEQSKRLEEVLVSTSLFEVHGESDEPGLLLVQEEGMSQRPSLLLDLSTADVLRYWALLTPEQRSAFIEARVAAGGEDDPLVAKLAPLRASDTLFDRFAGTFHAFNCLEERVRTALQGGQTREADYRLFGKKYDSLGPLLERVRSDFDAQKGDRVEQYVVTLCAKQLVRELKDEFSEYFAARRADVLALDQRIRETAALRESIAASDPETPAFLEWFERWFLRRAEAIPAADEAAE